MQTYDNACINDISQQLGEVQIADFCLARISGMSSPLLDHFVLQKTVQLINQAFDVEEPIHALTSSIEDILYALIPQLGEEKQVRRRVLAMKRNVHNERLWSGAQEDIAFVIKQISEESQRQELVFWYQKASEREKLLEQAASQYKQELEKAAQVLFSCVKDRKFQQGLALASQDVIKALMQFHVSYKETDWKPASKIARTSLSYLTRAAMKTSPFSTFTQLRVTEFEPETFPLRNSDQEGISADVPARRNVVRLTHTIPFTWLMCIARDPELAVILSFESNQGINFSDKDKEYARILTTDYVYFGQLAGRNERLVKRRFDRRKPTPLVQFLESNERLGYQELLSLLTATGQFRNMHKTVVQLLDMQVIRPIAPYKRLEPRPSLALALALEQLPGKRAHDIASTMRLAQFHCEEIENADAADRLANLAHLRKHIQLVFEQLGVEPPEWLEKVSLVYEDVRFDCPQIELPHGIKDDLALFAQSLRPHMVRTKMYDYLYHFFVRNFGEDGETNDIQGFLQQFLEQDNMGELTLRAMAEDCFAMNNTEEGRSCLLPGMSSTPPACTVFFQIAAEDQEALARGEYKLIVNQVNSGQGGLLSRFSRLLQSSPDALNEKLHQWILSLHGKKRVLEMPVVGDWNDLQSAQGLSEQVLQWPAELSAYDKENTLRLRDLRLQASKVDTTLYLVDNKGQIVTPSYLGIIPSHFSPYILNLFLQMLDPWLNGWIVKPFDMEEETPEQIQFTARREVGRVVTQRASWYIPLSQLPQRIKNEDDFAFFVRVQRWRREYQLPEEVFASRGDDRASFDSKKRKPIWIHFGSPHTLELLSQFIDKDTSSITLTEVLPARSQHWLIDQSIDTTGVADRAEEISHPTRRHASEFMVLTRWPLPTPSPVPSRQRISEVLQVEDPKVEWLYFKVYTQGPEQLDAVIRSLVVSTRARARLQGVLAGWFYIRFYDELGWHIRLRLQVQAACAQQIQAEFLALIEEMPPQIFSPVLQNREEMKAELPNLSLTVSIHQYEPEYEKFGGLVGIAIAERLFEASSEFAVKFLTLENSEEFDRLLIAIVLTQSMLQEAYPDVRERTRFLQYYLWYWTNQNRAGASDARKEFKKRALQSGSVYSSKVEDVRRRENINELLQEFGDVFIDTLSTCADRMKSQEYALRQLCFDHIHLNNNRLGISTTEEGYLAALLLTM